MDLNHRPPSYEHGELTGLLYPAYKIKIKMKKKLTIESKILIHPLKQQAKPKSQENKLTTLTNNPE